MLYRSVLYRTVQLRVGRLVMVTGLSGVQFGLTVIIRVIGRFYTKDALSVWTNLGKYFVVRLGYASLV